ncbi:uncharacterized protein H6S33_000871 [Morchella sextelata]|uniref:uncharacterized protein n=1 Tax=Morchella sextelata TaxID=1174677 RepID=UPI001D051CA2|nr:uncharacterized protein H6S33_000871 [Morchella sextelata]KAH0615235.1 hypothetical protein H6S33_000871 [Morchella sextelata]
MDNQERSTKKRKVAERDSKKPEPTTVAKSPVGKKNTQKKPANGPKSPKAKSEKSEKTDKPLVETEKQDDVQEVAIAVSDVTLSTPKVFSDLNLTPEIQKTISAIGYSELKGIQSSAIPALLTDKDVIVTSAAGSGKSTAALVSSISLLQSKRFRPRNGTGVIILTPTREVAHQFLGVATELLEDAPQSVGIVTDQANFRAEAEKLTRGINLLIATPSQLLEHLKKTLAFSVKGLHTIILDDCERLMDTKTQESVKQILELLPKKKQIVLLTSTESSVAEGLPLKKPVTVRAKGTTSSEVVTDASRVQGYVMVSTDKRFILLFSFVKKFQKKKVIVVTSSTAAAKAYGDILNAMDLPVSQMHGKQNSKINASNLAEFNEAEQGTLICTDAVYQTLEAPKVDWIVQYDPPENPTRYISRIGTSTAKSVIFLQPTEAGFIDYLKDAGVTPEEFDFSNRQLAAVQLNLRKLVAKNYAIHCEAKDAFRSYLKNYTSHILPSVFSVKALDLVQVSKSFGFEVPPRVEVGEPEAKEERWKMTYGPATSGLQGVKRRRGITG